LKKGAIEGGVVGDQLRDMVGASIRGEHGKGGVATKELGEALCDFLGLMRLPCPKAAAVVALSKAMSLGLALVKAHFCFKRFEGVKVFIDGHCGKLNDRVSLGVQSTRFQVNEYEPGRDVSHGRVCHSRHI
jgi:hypothetical protein